MLTCQNILCKREFAPKNNQQLYCSVKCQANFCHGEYRKRFAKGAKIYRFLQKKHPNILVKIENMMNAYNICEKNNKLN